MTLTLTDDESAPTATLSLDPASVSENGGASTVSATLSHPSSQPSTVTVTAVSGAYTVGSDATITIAAGATTAATDTATVAGVDDDVHQGTSGRSVTVTATLANGQGARVGDGGGADPERRRDVADGESGSRAVVGLGERRGGDGDGGAVGSVEPAGDADGGDGGGGLVRRGGGRTSRRRGRR